MKTGVIFPSFAEEIVWSATTNPWLPDYPLSNVNDIVRPSKLARATAEGTRIISGVFPGIRPVQALALVGHNYLSGVNTIRIYGFSGTGNDPVVNAAEMVYDSGSFFWWPSGLSGIAGYRMTRPHVLPSAINMRSIRILLNNNVPGLVFEIEAIEVGGFWQWPGVSYGRENGFRTRDVREKAVGGASRGSKRKDPRVIRGQIDLLRMSVTQTQGLDFQKRLDIQRPFVWMQDYDDPSTWARLCMLVRNEQVSPMVGRLYRHDAFPINLVEHMR